MSLSDTEAYANLKFWQEVAELQKILKTEKNKVTSGTQSGPNLAGLVPFKDLKQSIVWTASYVSKLKETK